MVRDFLKSVCAGRYLYQQAFIPLRQYDAGSTYLSAIH